MARMFEGEIVMNPAGRWATRWISAPNGPQEDRFDRIADARRWAAYVEDALGYAATVHSAATPATDDRDRQIVALRAAAPLRPCDRTAAPVDGLALFDVVRSPRLI